MTNRALIVAIIIVCLAWVGIIGYVIGNTNKQLSVTPTEPSDSGVTQQPQAKSPKVFEKDIPILVPVDAYRDSPKVQDQQTLSFPVEAGNKVEGEVTVSKGTVGGIATSTNEAWVLIVVRDPHVNIVQQYPADASINRFEKYPWRFSFIASTTGQYSVEVATKVWLMGKTFYAAHPKVTVYDK